MGNRQSNDDWSTLVTPDIWIECSAGWYRDIKSGWDVLPGHLVFYLPWFPHFKKSLFDRGPPSLVSASPNTMLISAVCLSLCVPINQEKHVVCSRNRGKQGSGSGSIGDSTMEYLKKWTWPFKIGTALQWSWPPPHLLFNAALLDSQKVELAVLL